MVLIVCVDDEMGMLFNHRRQSQDKELRERILKHTDGKHLWMNHYSAKQFEEAPQINIDDEYMNEATSEDFCFAEDCSLIQYEQWVDKIILYRWNRRYPADMYFDIPLYEHGWKLVQSENFAGSSHEKITEEFYVK